MKHTSYDVTMVVCPPIPTIYNKNPNLTTRPNMMDLLNAPIAPVPGKEEQAKQAARVAEEVERLGTFLSGTAYKGKHVLNLHDSIREMHIDLLKVNGELEHRALYGTSILPHADFELEQRRNELRSNIITEQREFMFAVRELVDVTLKTID